MSKRHDAWKLGGGWNDTFHWYAQAILELQSRELTDRTSWRYLAAIHQFDRRLWIDEGIIEATTPLPPKSDIDVAWNQCQHSSYFFLPWHRGYLACFERIIAATILELGGPADWRLPYWNYLDAANPDARRIPDAFLFEFLPDGTTRNPLNDVPRFGQTVLGPEPLLYIDDIDLSAMSQTRFTGAASFGGSRTMFANPGRGVRGQLENVPHGSVHVLVGGAPPANPAAGYLSAFETAGLDPLFWLHHCNLDRLWEAWMGKPGITMESSKQWLDGPSDRAFAVPSVDGSALETFTARDTLAGGKFHPDYDDLVSGTGVPLKGSGGAVVVDQGAKAMTEPVVIGANAEMLVLGTGSVETEVRIAPEPAIAVVTEMGPAAAEATDAKRLLLKLENIRGEAVAGGLKAFLNPPATQDAGDADEFAIGSAALFGLGSASKVDGPHGGNGITLVFDVTELAAKLIAKGDFDPERLRVRVVAAHGGGDAKPVTIDRISVLRE